MNFFIADLLPIALITGFLIAVFLAVAAWKFVFKKCYERRRLQAAMLAPDYADSSSRLVNRAASAESTGAAAAPRQESPVYITLDPYEEEEVWPTWRTQLRRGGGEHDLMWDPFLDGRHAEFRREFSSALFHTHYRDSPVFRASDWQTSSFDDSPYDYQDVVGRPGIRDELRCFPPCSDSELEDDVGQAAVAPARTPSSSSEDEMNERTGEEDNASAASGRSSDKEKME